ncbi:hypothetical protein FA15DRAFT_654275 [Coprinopsis marcescibilis]|uniref:Uncharacterized protein n=1 Tax=Coprinopsis marcescibilis TaxID=230819 RepID=A0A5C3L1K7_COPMA|nr:hypothetical protein FA15DRAFT_654275 [Coprinopsis marcescibilis]
MSQPHSSPIQTFSPVPPSSAQPATVPNKIDIKSSQEKPPSSVKSTVSARSETCTKEKKTGRYKGALEKPFPSFNSQSEIIQPFQDDRASDRHFEQELARRLIDLMLETHAWSAARPRIERQEEERKLETELTKIAELEQSQEETRQRLVAFIHSVQSAIMALKAPLRRL